MSITATNGIDLTRAYNITAFTGDDVEVSSIVDVKELARAISGETY